MGNFFLNILNPSAQKGDDHRYSEDFNAILNDFF